VESAIPKPPPISWVEWTYYAALRQALVNRDFRVLTLDGAGITSHEVLFAQAAREMPQNPPLGPGHSYSWDALDDSLWGGFRALDEQRIAVMWRHVDVLLAHDAEVLVNALESFRDTAVALYATPDKVVVKVFLVGAGSSFKPFIEPE
jgi:hypothetical protein